MYQWKWSYQVRNLFRKTAIENHFLLAPLNAQYVTTYTVLTVFHRKYKQFFQECNSYCLFRSLSYSTNFSPYFREDLT